MSRSGVATVEGPRSLLVLRLSALGDVLFALPAAQACKDAGHRVAFLVEDKAAALLALADGIDEVLVFPRRRALAWPAHAVALLARRDDVVLDLQCNAKSRLQRLLLRAPVKLGFDVPLAREGGHRGLTERFQPDRRARHKAAVNMALLARLGLPVPAAVPRPRLRWSREVDTRARAMLARVLGHGPVVVLHPGTSAFGELKRWAPERFGELALRLARELSARVLVTAGPGEEGLVRRVLAAARGSGACAVPPSGLPDLAGLLAASDLAVAADSLPLHLANALGTPVVGLYGPKDPAVTGPAWDRASVVRAGVACSPCTLRRCGDRICMERLPVGAVLAAARQRLAEGRARRHDARWAGMSPADETSASPRPQRPAPPRPAQAPPQPPPQPPRQPPPQPPHPQPPPQPPGTPPEWPPPSPPGTPPERPSSPPPPPGTPPGPSAARDRADPAGAAGGSSCGGPA